MDIELKELSNIYLQTLKEQEDGAGQNPQQSVDVGSHAKAIRYQARRDNVPLPKAFNDYVAKNQLSGAERTALRQKLGFMESTEMVEEKKCNYTKEGKECPEHGIKECPMDEQKENTEITEIHGQAHKPHEVPTGDIKKLVKKAVKRIDTDVDGDTDKNDKAKGELGEFIPGVGNKRLYSTTRTKTAKESFSDWRGEIRELVDVTSSKPKTDEKSSEKISEKKIKNKIVINPPQGMTEAIEQLGGQILEMVEIEEAVYGGTPKKKEEPKDTRMVVTNADKKGNTPAYQKMKAGDKRYKAADHMGEEVEDLEEIAPAVVAGGVKLGKAALGFAARRIAPTAIRAAGSMAGGAIKGGAALGAAAIKAGSNNNSQKKQTTTTTTTTEEVGSTSTGPDPETKKQLAVKDQMMRKQQMLSRQRLQMQKQGKLPSGHMEELSISDQMRISREANAKRKPYEPGDRQKQRAAQIKQMAKNSSKDTRTDAQKMTDATGPRPGSRYRGD